MSAHVLESVDDAIALLQELATLYRKVGRIGFELKQLEGVSDLHLERDDLEVQLAHVHSSIRALRSQVDVFWG